jgi:two-component sensor histidine kinase
MVDMTHNDVTHDGVLRFPQRSRSSKKELRLALTDAETQFVQRDRALADAKAQVAQRDRRLVELSHRFANSLQILSSSLRTDSRRVLHEDAKLALDTAAMRVLAVARLHRQLAEHEADERLDLYRFLNDLASELEESTGLRCDIDGESFIVSGDMGFRLATAVTELVLNVRKHADDGKDDGRVCITCHRMGTSQLRLSVSDSGKGLPKGFNPENAHGVGMSLIVAAAKHLNGELNVRNADGACFTLIVPIEQML